MSDCGVCLSGPEDGCYEELESGTVKARKAHRCGECRRVIAVGETYYRFKGVWEGEIVAERACLICQEIRTAFACNGFVYGQLWEDMKDFGFGALNDSCFLKLQTVEAKRYLRERWMKWKGLTI